MLKKLFIVFTSLIFLLTLALVVLKIFVRSENSPETNPNSEIPIAEASEPASVDSPDGKEALVMKISKSGEESTYTFSASGKIIFQKTVNSSVTFSLPANSWSPDNKYVFLKEEDPRAADFLVLSVAKDTSQQDDQTANITSLFYQKHPDLAIDDVTGWGGMNVIVINSLKADGKRGPSFWFEMPSHAIIQLADRF